MPYDRATAQTLADYRADLLAVGIPEPLTDAIVLSAADRLHTPAIPALPSPALPLGLDDEWAPGEFEAARAAAKARRAAELAEVG
jgi:hypothetical protein